MDTIERTYFAFRRRLRDIGQASVCDCNACIRMPALDLKLVAHHGTIVRQRIAGREELRRARRSSWSTGCSRTRSPRTTRAAAPTRSTPTPASRRWASPTRRRSGSSSTARTYEHLGEVTVWVDDLDAAWDERAGPDAGLRRGEGRDRHRTTTILPAPAAIAWDYQTSPARRPQLAARASPRSTRRPAGGRRGVGTTNHCVHGKDAIVEEILDWRPYDYLTLKLQVPIAGRPQVHADVRLRARTATGPA